MADIYIMYQCDRRSCSDCLDCQAIAQKKINQCDLLGFAPLRERSAFGNAALVGWSNCHDS